MISTGRTPRTASTSFFFSNHPPPTHIHTLSLHDALPISARRRRRHSDNSTSAEWRKNAPLSRHRFFFHYRQAYSIQRASSPAPQRLIENARERPVHPSREKIAGRRSLRIGFPA